MGVQDLQGLRDQTARPFACRARQEQKQLAVAAEQGVCLCCDRVWMREAVGNLIKNALDHTRAGDTVTVEGSRFADFVRIRVVDTGTGIHPEDLPHLFKRFYRSRFALLLRAGYAGHRAGAAAGEIHCGGPRRHTGSGK